MSNQRSFWFYVLVFILAQVAWLILLVLWIYWYASNYMFISEMGEKFSQQLTAGAPSLLVLIGGLLLLVAIATGMSLLFYRLSVQLKMSRLYDNFIANVTHELKSPLAAIQLHLETFNAHDLSRSEYRTFVNVMLKDCRRLSDLINSILKIPALEQKKIAHEFRIENMQEMTEDILDEVQDQFELSSDSLLFSGSADCQCVVDRAALKIVVDNLVDNSIKYSKNSVQIQISFFCDRTRFVLNYTDRGIGIPRTEQKNVFDKFYRIDSAHSSNVKGTGLGLYWARQIMRYHGGDITAVYRYGNRGAFFKLELPRYPTKKKRYLKSLIEMSQKKQDARGKNGGN
ncbi:MAG: sensor histidine kinase [Thermodesulfobacteriota bacterium]